MSEPFAYDAVEYPTNALGQAHPGHLHAVARMFGLDPAPPDRCRYLEVGCGDGMHLIGCALELPGAEFVGIDLSAVAVERGRRVIAELGLPNVSLYAADLTAWEPPGRFDYAVAHGLYSWVPAPVRDGLLSLVARVLPPHGVGYVSYNAYPGCYVRRMVWEMMRHHTADVPDPAGKIGQSRELLKFLAAGQPADGGPIPKLFAHEINGLLNDHDPRVLYHDDLSPANEPVYFHQFAAHAARFGLRFVAEAEQNAMEPRAFPPAVAGLLNGLAARDPLQKEQYIDFLRLRRFRQTLLAADGGRPLATPDAARITTLHVSGGPQADPNPPDLSPGVAVTFSGGDGSKARTDLPVGKAALVILAERWPARISFAELVAEAAGRLGREATPDDAESLAGLLTAVWMAGLIYLHGDAPKYAAALSERPVSSPLARIQLRTGITVTTLTHESMKFPDRARQALVTLADGTRTLDELAEGVRAVLPQGEQPDPATLRAEVAKNLARLARAGLLIG